MATYRILDNLEYQQALQYEPSRKQPSGDCHRDEAVFISTKEDELSLFEKLENNLNKFKNVFDENGNG